ncbi:MAG: beta strand repeat-containing protein, partial [Planctomycetota bacterium]
MGSMGDGDTRESPGPERGRRLRGRLKALATLLRLGPLVLGSALLAGSAHAQPFTVTSTNDNPAPGTLRWAISSANGSPGADLIDFAIPGPGPHTIVLGSDLPTVTDPVTIDATTQAGWAAGAPVIELNGAGANTFAVLTLGAGSAGSTVRGLVINQAPVIAIRIFSSNNVLEGNFLGTDVTGTLPSGNTVGVYIQSSGNQIDGTAAFGPNVISGNTVDGIQIRTASATGNVVQGNYIGVDVTGGVDVGNAAQGVVIYGGATGNTVGGTALTAGNVISGNNNYGVAISELNTTNNFVEGNYIGTDSAGTAPIPNQFGVGLLDPADGNTVGGSVAARNVISGNASNGMIITSDDNFVQLNYIGTDALGTTDVANGQHGVQLTGTADNNLIGGVGLGNVISGNGLNGIDVVGAAVLNIIQDNVIGRDPTNSFNIQNLQYGIWILNTSFNTVGGTNPGEGNVIAGNVRDGVAIVGAAASNAILRNSIFSNGGLGIDLADDDVTGNDLADADGGENTRQNFPVLSAVTTNGAGFVHIAGSLHAVPIAATYRVEFFAHDSPDPLGFGEAFRYLGFQDVLTDGAGNGIIGVTLGAAVTAGTDYVTATATDPVGNTSEFAANLFAVDDIVVTTTADTVDGTVTSVANLIADPGPGPDARISLREAILATNATAGTDTIRFGIPLTDANHLYYQDDT